MVLNVRGVRPWVGVRGNRSLFTVYIVIIPFYNLGLLPFIVNHFKAFHSSLLIFIWFQLLGGWLASRFGGKHVFGCGMLLAGIASILLPACARIHVSLVFVMRLITGMGTVSLCARTHVSLVLACHEGDNWLQHK